MGKTSGNRDDMKEIINWGIIAPGRISHRFVHDLLLVKNARLQAVASRSYERAYAFAQQYGAPHFYGSYEEILDCPDLDVVYVASPHSGHAEHSIMCLNRKIPVLCEKPLAVNAAQVGQMIQAAQKNNTFLMEAIWTRFNPLFEEAIRMVDSGIIGAVKTIRADFGYKADFPPEHRLFNLDLAGGSFLDVGMYPVFLATLLFGSPEEVKATAVFGKTGADESCAVLLSYSGGRMAILDSSIVMKTATEAFLYGENGTLCLHRRFHHPKELTVSFYDKREEHIALPSEGYGYYHEIVEVNRCLLEGKTESDKLPLKFSLELIKVLDRVRQEAGIFYPGIDGND